MIDGEGWEGTKGNWVSSVRGDREEGQLAAPGHRARQRQRLSDEIQAEFANVFGSRRAAVAAPKPPASVKLPLGSSFQVPMASVPEASPRPSSWPLNSTCPVRRGRSGSPPHLQVWPTPIAAVRDRRHQSIPGSRPDYPRSPASKRMSHWNACPATAVSRSPHATPPNTGDDDWGPIDADPAAQAAEISHRASKTESALRLPAGHGDRRRHRIQTYALPIRHRAIRFKTATSQRINATCNTGCLAVGRKTFNYKLSIDSTSRVTCPARALTAVRKAALPRVTGDGLPVRRHGTATVAPTTIGRLRPQSGAASATRTGSAHNDAPV